MSGGPGAPFPRPCGVPSPCRDGGCRFPGCTRPTGWTDAHHVVHWRHGGRTDLANLVLLCDHHHHVVHQPDWIVKFDGHELRVLKPDGIELLE